MQPGTTQQPALGLARRPLRRTLLVGGIEQQPCGDVLLVRRALADGWSARSMSVVVANPVKEAALQIVARTLFVLLVLLLLLLLVVVCVCGGGDGIINSK